MVNIYLSIDDIQVHLLSIPLEDIRRLSLRPLKWLRFVAFAVCGAHGDLFETADGLAVNYGASLFDDLLDSYHYIHQGDFVFVDLNGTNDRITSSSQTLRRNSFRQNIMDRDGPHCITTREEAEFCDAAHIIPLSKGDEYINRVVQVRGNLYDSSEGLEIPGINAVENGVFLRKDLHVSIATGSKAFLKTPNFALEPDDIPRIELGSPTPMPLSRITMQTLKASEGLFPVLDVDACFTGTRTSLPPAVLLDYMYGIAAYMRWRGGSDIDNMMTKYFLDHYESIPIPLPDKSSDEDEMDSSTSDDSEYEPTGTRRSRQRNHVSHTQDKMVQAMDELNFFIMSLRGITPEVLAAQRQRTEEEERVASRDKVLEWMKDNHDVRSME